MKNKLGLATHYLLLVCLLLTHALPSYSSSHECRTQARSFFAAGELTFSQKIIMKVKGPALKKKIATWKQQGDSDFKIAAELLRISDHFVATMKGHLVMVGLYSASAITITLIFKNLPEWATFFSFYLLLHINGLIAPMLAPVINEHVPKIMTYAYRVTNSKKKSYRTEMGRETFKHAHDAIRTNMDFTVEEGRDSWTRALILLRSHITEARELLTLDKKQLAAEEMALGLYNMRVLFFEFSGNELLLRLNLQRSTLKNYVGNGFFNIVFEKLAYIDPEFQVSEVKAFYEKLLKEQPIF